MVSDRDPKLQRDEVPGPASAPPDAIVSPDTYRPQRIPPGQSRTKKWPVLDASGPPRIATDRWRLTLQGLVRNPFSWNWDALLELPRVKVFADFHYVTRWSRLGNLWEGVATREIVSQGGGVRPECRSVLAFGYDYRWTTNIPIEDFLAGDALIATHHDGEPISLEHGGPARLIVPRLYAWKSAKWLSGLEFLAEDEPGFWERNGYHMHGDPWMEERFGY